MMSCDRQSSTGAPTDSFVPTSSSVPADISDFRKWIGFYDLSGKLLNSKDYKGVSKLEEESNLSLVNPIGSVAFAGFVLNCAIARRLGNYGDPLSYLLFAEKSIKKVREGDGLDSLRVSLAKELINIKLYRRALEILLDVSPDRAKSPDIEAEKVMLAQALTVSRPSLSGLSADKSSVDAEGRIRERLLDIVAQITENPYYDEMSLVKESRKDAIKFFQESKPFSRDPLMLQFFKKDKHAPRPIAEDDGDSDEEGISLELTPEVIQARDRLSSFLSGSNSKAIAESTLPSSLEQPEAAEAVAELLYAVAGDAGEKKSILRLHPEGFLIFVPNRLDSFLIFIPFRESSPQEAWKISVPGSVQIYQLDVNSDGIPEIILLDREGSGGFLSVDVIDVLPMHTLFSTKERGKGGVAFVNLDDDSDLEIIVTEGASFLENFEKCVQCPSRIRAEVYDFDKNSSMYKYRGYYGTSSEVLRGNGDPWGLGPHMYFLLEEKDGDDYREDLARLRSLPLESISDDLVERLTSTISQRCDLLAEQGLFSVAAERKGEFVEVLRSKNLSSRPRLVDTLARTRLEEILLLFQSGELETALKYLEQAWLVSSAKKNKSNEIFATELRGALALNLGKLDQAYSALDEVSTLIGKPNEAVEGNRSWYFRLVGDFGASYRTALAALDIAVRNDNASGKNIDMMHLASAAASERRYGESLDWIARALRWSRAGGGGSGLLEISASIALDTGYPQICLLLLDEAIALTDSITWNAQGGSIMLLYGKALLSIGRKVEAAEALAASAKLARTPNSSIYVAAKYELSKMAYTDGRRSVALSYARESFEAIATGRRLIREEQHKFSFLLDKESVVGWFFKLLLEENVGPEELLGRLESWKMQAFLDVYDKDGLVFREGTPVNVPKLKGWLSDGDFFVNYFISDQANFAVSMSDRGETDIFKLQCSAKDIRSEVLRTQSYFDIRNSVSLGYIRQNEVSDDLKGDLTRLGECLLSGVKLPVNVRRLIIASDKNILGVPWAALKLNGEALVHSWEVTQVPSAGVALRQLALRNNLADGTNAQRKTALIIAGLGAVREDEVRRVVSWGGGSRATSLPELSGGGKECEAVAKSLPNYKAEILADRNSLSRFPKSELATPENMLREMGKAEIVHVVAHGVFNPLAPMRSALFLESGGKGRILTASDLSFLDLRKTKLVCLSACQTGVNGAAPGAEPIGFLRALLGSGVNNVVLTEWQVDDRTTAQLFAELYRVLPRMRVSAALRQSQVKIEREYKHPYFWAGISVYGY
jgi:CHAT domain-containing protein/tetratricopeptide (TPR) repeat protein